jgi:hypothetical protein
MPFDPNVGIQIIENHRGDISATQQEQNDYIAEVMKRLERSAEDRREAGKLAVEAAKMFVTIGVAGIAVIGGFVQFARNSGFDWDSWPILLFAFSALSILISMWQGFNAISRTYQRADGRLDDPAGLAWSTAAIRNPLNFQALAGLASLALFAAAIVASGFFGQPKATMLTLSVPSQPAITAASTDQVAIEGEWTNLLVRTKAGLLVQLPAVQAGQTESFSIKWK